jgi:hypothetical protein
MLAEQELLQLEPHFQSIGAQFLNKAKHAWYMLLAQGRTVCKVGDLPCAAEFFM